MFRQIGIDVIPLTREFVEDFAALPTFDGDRSRETVAGRRRIAWLKNKLDAGTFFSPTWATAVLNGCEHRMNGGHSAEMFRMPGAEIPAGLLACVLRFHCETAIDMANLFDQFDPGGSMRTASDGLNAHKCVEFSLAGIATQTLKIITSGIDLHFCGFGNMPRLTDEERRALLHAYSEFIAWAAAFLKKKHLRRPGIVAAMYATYCRSERAAKTFWAYVAEENHPRVHDATRTLATFYRDSALDLERNRAAWDQRAFYVKSLHGWNAWCDERSTTLAYHRNAGFPTLQRPL